MGDPQSELERKAKELERAMNEFNAEVEREAGRALLEAAAMKQQQDELMKKAADGCGPLLLGYSILIAIIGIVVWFIYSRFAG